VVCGASRLDLEQALQSPLTTSFYLRTLKSYLAW